MLIVQIELWEGRNDEQKAKLIDAVTDAFTVLGIEKTRARVHMRTRWIRTSRSSQH